jgi:hypothetical protein
MMYCSLVALYLWRGVVHSYPWWNASSFLLQQQIQLWKMDGTLLPEPAEYRW